MRTETDAQREPVLSCRGVRARYGLLEVVRGVDLDVHPGETICLIGPNGAGKTSLLGSICGHVRGSGHVRVGGSEVSRRAAFVRARAGIGFVPDNRGLFPALTVSENLTLGSRLAPARQRSELVESLLATFPVLRTKLRAAAGSMSGGEQQMLAMAKALAGDPLVLILDEPSQGLAPRIVDELGEVLVTLRERGISILLAEQNFRLVTRVSDRFVLLTGGEVRLAGPRDDLTDMDSIKKGYLG